MQRKYSAVLRAIAAALAIALLVVLVLDTHGGSRSKSSDNGTAGGSQDNGPPPNFVLAIVNSDANGVGGVTVRLASPTSDGTITLGSDEGGNVAALVPTGGYYLSTAKHGYQPAMLPLLVGDDGAVLLDNAFAPLPEQGKIALVRATEPVVQDAQGSYVLSAGISSEDEAKALLRVHGIVERNDEVVCNYTESYGFSGDGFETARAGTTLVFAKVQGLRPQPGFVCTFVEGASAPVGESVFVEQKCGNVAREGDDVPAPKPKPTATPTPTATTKPPTHGKQPSPTATDEEPPDTPGRTATPTKSPTNTPEPPCTCCGCDPGPYPEPTAIPTNPVIIINPTPEPTRPPTPTLPPAPTRPDDDDLPTPLPR